MSESNSDKVARVQMMVRGDATWDLSDNDREALAYVLEQTKKVPALEARNEYIKDAISAESHEIEQLLGTALHYPRLAADHVNFPEMDPDDPEVCVGEHVPITLVMEAARKIAQLEKEGAEQEQKGAAWALDHAVSQIEYTGGDYLGGDKAIAEALDRRDDRIIEPYERRIASMCAGLKDLMTITHWEGDQAKKFHRDLCKLLIGNGDVLDRYVAKAIRPLREFIQEVALLPYPDSDPSSLLKTLQRRAKEMDENREHTCGGYGER